MRRESGASSIRYPPPSQISRKGQRLVDRPLLRAMTFDWSMPITPELSRVRARRSRQLRDQSRAALAGEIRPNPLMLHAQAVLQLRQGEDMNERPHQPRQEAACAQPAPLQHRVILADDGHVALVEIAERAFDLPPHQLFRDQPPDVPPFLNRCL